MQHPQQGEKLPHATLPLLIIEILIIIVVGILATSIYADFDPQKRLGGPEMEYLTRTAYSFAIALPEKGYIPLWQPYMESGDPMLENPVSFAFNPFLTWPSIPFGPYNGTKISTILTAVLAGLGGWSLGRVIGLGTLARVLLGLLCIGVGNMHSFISQGHFALFVAQSYFSWIFAGIIASFRGFKRWPLILTAVAFALIFWTGIPWYPPAVVIAIGFLTLPFLVEFGSDQSAISLLRRLHIRLSRLLTVSVALILTLCLSAITFLPLWTKRDNIGTSTILSDARIDLGVILQQYFSGYKDLNNPPQFPPGTAYSYYSYISPLWYVLLIGALLLLLVWLKRKMPLSPFHWRVLIGAVAIFVFCTLWGAGQNPLIELSYDLIPLATQFRHVARVLGLSAVWLAVIIAISVDLLWQNLVRKPVWINNRWASSAGSRIGLRLAFGTLLVVASALAAYDVDRQWHVSWGSFFVRYEEDFENYCITALRQQYPDQELSVWTLDYKNIYTYLRNRVRHGWVASDFYHASPIPPTLYTSSLLPVSDGPVQLMPEFAIGITHYDDAWMERYGYVPMPESANPYAENRPCMYRREGAYSYAWWTTTTDLINNPNTLPKEVTHTITSFARDYDRIGLLVQGSADADVVVTVQEVAYPGWHVFIDGQPANLESVGGQIGVLLPRENRRFAIKFEYLPQTFLRGSIITLITIAFCVLYLLRADRLFPRLNWNEFGNVKSLLKRLDPLEEETKISNED
ncbi:MAG: hypothetical protein KF726_00490 [Anaerolineae bacterium]|nr:hypothetical protein [Anaerolineae bacterium]